MSATFLSIFYQMISLQKLWKCFLFHLKSSLRSQDIQIFAFRSFPLLVPVSHCLRGWSKKNLKVYDVMNCLNKNLITPFVWYLGKNIFMEKSFWKCAPKKGVCVCVCVGGGLELVSSSSSGYEKSSEKFHY